MAIAALTALLGAAALAAPASAERYQDVVEIPKSEGNLTSVFAYGGRVSMSAWSHRRDSLYGQYSAPGRVSPRGIVSNLGRFGSVDLRFDPQGKPKRIPRPRVCSGGAKYVVEWQGTFSGLARFTPDAGLHGFTRNGVLNGSVRTVPPWHCDFPEPRPVFDPNAGGFSVDAASCDGRAFGANVEVDPANPPPPPGDGPYDTADYSASWRKKVGIATVDYGIGVEGGPESAVFSDDLSEGTITPPPPFHGEATIRKEGDGWAWSGSLTARFPGQTVSLTGASFKPLVRTYKPRPNTSYAFYYSFGC